MTEYICYRIPQDGMRIVLADGPEGGPVWADLFAIWNVRSGWDLLIETNLPEWVSLKEVYFYFRQMDMTTWEWKQATFWELPGKDMAIKRPPKAPKWFKPDQWYHLPFETPPPEYKEGWLEGTRKELSDWLRPGADDRELRRRVFTRAVWVRRISGNRWEICFRHKSLFDFANQNRLKGQQNRTE